MIKALTLIFVMLPGLSMAATWYKGSIHAHTTDSDGQQTPAQVTQWYKDQGYNFLALTDHNWFSPVEFSGLSATYNGPAFLMISGEEVSDYAGDRGVVHIVGLNITRLVPPTPGGGPAADVVRVDASAIAAAGGVPIYAHPSYDCCPTLSDMTANGLKFMEVYNPAVTTIPNEPLWDYLLSGGALVYGTAVDDTHSLTAGQWAAAGHAWIVVRAASLTTADVLGAMQTGDFYASSGVQLADVAVNATAYTVTVSAVAGHSYQIQFIGKNGTVLSTVYGTSGSYAFQGTEGYVRSVVTDLSQADTRAWTQPRYVTAPVTPVTVSISPGNTTMNAGASRQFKAHVTGTTNTAVTWSVSPNIGTLTPTGQYTAPSLSSQQAVTIRATSVANPSAAGTSVVTIKAVH